jgi:hypothetical protein
LEFGAKRSEIKGNSEYQSHREFHKLSKEGDNSDLQYRANEAGRIKVERIIEI